MYKYSKLFISVIFLSMIICSLNSQPETGFLGEPFHTLNSYPETAAFDLDRSSGSNADWTGWKSGDPTSGYGHAYDNHTGTDWGMSNYTDLYNVYDGTVTWIRENIPDNTNNDPGDPGNGITVEHNVNGVTYLSLHYHLAYNSVVPAVSDFIAKGVKIAESDHTGHSTGPHLHFSIAKTSDGGSGNYTCGFYHGWFEDDEFYYDDTRLCLRYMQVINASALNCRRGTSTSYDVVTQALQDQVYVACQRNGWYRIFVPMPPSKAYESRDSGGSLASGYSESGAWNDSTDKSSVSDPAGDANYVSLSGAGSRYSTFTGSGGSETATFTFSAPQRGNYSIYATWPAESNAADVTYRITHNGGSTDVVIDQAGLGSTGGDGSHASPYIIDHMPCSASHTTVGGDDTWDSYSPEGSGLDESGPERIYRLEIFETSDISITVDHSGYPTLDVDIHFLGSLSNSDCLARGDWSVSYSAAPAGTYYIAMDSYGGDSSATSYDISVELNSESPYPNSWVDLGEFFYARGDSGSVQIMESSVTGKVDPSREGRVYADAIKVVPEITYRSVWASDSYLAQVTGTNLESNRMGCVGIAMDKTAGNDSREITEYSEVPIYAEKGVGSSNSSAIVGKAVTGQRFVSDKKEDNWYRVFLSNGCDAEKGWIYGDMLFAFHEPWILPAELSVLSIE